MLVSWRMDSTLAQSLILQKCRVASHSPTNTSSGLGKESSANANMDIELHIPIFVPLGFIF